MAALTGTGPSPGVPLVDVHAHFVTPWYVDAATRAGHQHPDGMPGWPTWSVEDHLRVMDEHGSTRRCCRSPRRACTSGTSLDELNAVGIVVESSTGGTYLHDPSYQPFFSELDGRGTTLFVHPTSPPGHEQTALGYPRPMLEFLVETTRALTGLVVDGTTTRNPGARIIASHCGAFLPLMIDRLKVFTVGLGGDPATVDDALALL